MVCSNLVKFHAISAVNQCPLDRRCRYTAAGTAPPGAGLVRGVVPGGAATAGTTLLGTRMGAASTHQQLGLLAAKLQMVYFLSLLPLCKLSLVMVSNGFRLMASNGL